jgi:hypothetical protein
MRLVFVAFITLERTIEAGQQTFVEVGLALTEIRDSKLYRADFETFDQYCQKRWGWSQKRASHLIIASEVVKMLPVKDSTIVENEGQARQLAKVPAEKRVEVLRVAKESGPVTAKTIHEAAAIVAPTLTVSIGWLNDNER